VVSSVDDRVPDQQAGWNRRIGNWPIAPVAGINSHHATP
jgi:hypothetical protein